MMCVALCATLLNAPVQQTQKMDTTKTIKVPKPHKKKAAKRPRPITQGEIDRWE